MNVNMHELNAEELDTVSGGVNLLGAVLDAADALIDKSYQATGTVIDGVKESLTILGAAVGAQQ